jgi:hypothetical protein
MANTLIENRLNSCLLFNEMKCPHELIMQRVYLVPQLLDVLEAKQYKTTCLKCRQFVNRDIHLSETKESHLTPKPIKEGI